MEDQTNRYPGFDPRTTEGRAYVAVGVWLRVALVGAVAAVAGIVQLLTGRMPALTALALAAAGVALAEIGRRRTQAALGGSRPADVTPVSAPSALDVRAALGR